MAFAVPCSVGRLALATRHISVQHPHRRLRIATHANADRVRSDGKRGFALLRSDLRKLAQIARGDFSALVDQESAFVNYDAAAIAAYYDVRPFSAIVRMATVGVPFALWLLRVRVFDKWWRGSDEGKSVTLKRADELRRLVCWAGPTYLKIAQAVGNRPDLIGVTYANELQKLTDDVGTFDTDVALRILHQELQISNLDEVFAEFNPIAVASASLGQVHKARLVTGEEVAVKIQRPSVERNAALDVYVLRRAAQVAKNRFKLRSDLAGIVDEFGTRLWEELDYNLEADNCDRFRGLYADDDIYVPAVYRKFTRKRILCLEWIDGSKAPWLPKAEAQRLIRIGVQCSLKQVCWHVMLRILILVQS